MLRCSPSLWEGGCIVKHFKHVDDFVSMLLFSQREGGMEGGNLYRNCCRESCPLFGVLRNRTPSSPIYLSEVIRKPLALSRAFLLSSGGKSIVLVKKKRLLAVAFSASIYVVLKTRHVNPNIHVRRFIVHARSPNLSATHPQLLFLRGATT